MKNSILVILALTLLCVNNAKSAGHKPKSDSLSCLLIEGRVLNSEEGIDGESKIELITSDGKIDSVILKEGRLKFKFILNKNSYYALRISKKGYISKLIAVNTELVTESFGIYKFTFETTLLRNEVLKYLNEDAVDFPVAIIHFDYENDCFSYNKEYTASIKKELRQSTQNRQYREVSTEMASASED